MAAAIGDVLQSKMALSFMGAKVDPEELVRLAQEADKAVPSRANGICFCVGSLGSRPDNDVVAMAKDFGPRIHFAHLRSTRIDDNRKSISFTESDHLDGDVNMIDVLRVLVAENARRPADEGIPFRPDHGHRMLDDIEKTRINPGYTGIGRLKGLAELRGAILALQ